MSNNPHAIDAVLLEKCDPEVQREFLKMLQDQRNTFELQKTHRCWFHVPNEIEWANMKKFAENDTCPKCGKGRIVIEIFRDTMGDSWSAVCRWNGGGCDFRESVSDFSRW